MKNTKILSGFLAVLFTAGVGVWLAVAYAAGSATLTLTPPSDSYANGSNFTVVIKENSSDQINTVQANLSYDQSKLQFVSIDTTSSTFDYALPSSGGSGSVSIARGVSNQGTVTGMQTVGSVTFKVLVGSGSTAISFASSSAIVRPSDGTNVWNGNTAGGNYSFTTPLSPPPPPPATPPSAPPPVPPTNLNTSVINNPNSPTSGGDTSSLNPTTNNIAAQQDNPGSPVPANDNIFASGILVAIKVLDHKDKIVKGADVTLDGKVKTKTDDTGIASFVGVPVGPHDIDVKSSAGTLKTSVVVLGDETAFVVQQFELKLANKPRSIVGWWLVPVAALPLLVAAAFVFRGKLVPLFSRIRNRGHKSNVTPEPSPIYPASDTFGVPPLELTERLQNIKTPAQPAPGNIVNPDKQF